MWEFAPAWPVPHIVLDYVAAILDFVKNVDFGGFRRIWRGLVGLDWIGLDCIGLGCIGLGWIALDWVGLHCIGLGWIALDWVGLHRVCPMPEESEKTKSSAARSHRDAEGGG